MPGLPPSGRYHFKRGVQLLHAPEGGVVLTDTPLRALRINRSAATMLAGCKRGGAADQGPATGHPPPPAAFLDALHGAGLLDWFPAPAERLPTVSIVIPVFRRPREIEACLSSLQSLDYPADKLEIVVVDDASPDHTANVVRRFDVRLIVLARNQGQSAARNTGVAAASGEIIAFMDSDCLASPGWLRELVPYFQDDRVALVGGRVGADPGKRWMDRYEAVCSALNMGDDPVMGQGKGSVFYVPTCNMLVRKTVYTQIGGLDEGLHVGEDVDLCWRLLAAGHRLHYVPQGEVLHKHRNRWWPGFVRRFEYGTSEAVLYARFPSVVKRFAWQPASLGLLLCMLAVLITPAWGWMAVMAGILAVETGCRTLQLRRAAGTRLTVIEMLSAIIKNHYRMAFYLTFILVRYYLLLLVTLVVCLPSQAGLWAAIILFPTLVTYLRKRPHLALPVFALFYLAEHAFYQSGALWGCLRQRGFRLYRIAFPYAGFMPRAKPPAASRSAVRPRSSTNAQMRPS